MSNTIERGMMAVVVLAAFGCTSVSGPSAGAASARLRFSVNTGTAAASPSTAPETISLGTDVLVLNRVDLVIRQIELERAGVTRCTATGDGSASASQESEAERHGNHGDGLDDCEEVELGPMLVTLPLGGGTTQQIEVPLAPGTYDRVQFQVHKPADDDAADRAFIAAHPEFRRVSIRVQGTFNGTAFEYVSDVSAQQQLVLSPPLVLASDSTASLSLTVDVHGWFLDNTRTHLVSPATALKGQPNENQVERNIKASLRARGYYGRDG